MICGKCKVDKPRSEFSRAEYRCRECCRARARAAREKQRVVQRPTYAPRSRDNQWCLRGHDTYKTGRRPGGQCIKCCSGRPTAELKEEARVVHERLPIGPLVERLKASGLQLRTVMSRTNEREIHRSVERGHISLMRADEICVKVLGLHPCDVYGPEFFEPTPITEAAA